MANSITELIRQIAFMEAGGRPEGQRDVDKLGEVFQAAGAVFDPYNKARATQLAIEKARRENMTVREREGLPSDEEIAKGKAKWEAGRAAYQAAKTAGVGGQTEPVALPEMAPYVDPIEEWKRNNPNRNPDYTLAEEKEQAGTEALRATAQSKLQPKPKLYFNPKSNEITLYETPGSVEISANVGASASIGKEKFDTGQGNTIINALRDDFTKSIGDFPKKVDAFNKINSTAKLQTVQGDQALLYNSVKLQDPNIVTAKELDIFANSPAVDDRVKQAYARLVKGQVLTPEMRQNLVNVANELYTDALAQTEAMEQQFTEKARGQGVSPDLVITRHRSVRYKKPMAGTGTNPPPTEKEVAVFDPQGNPGFVPVSQMKSAIEQGYKTRKP